MNLLIRYWITFDVSEGDLRQAGVSAYSLEDAQALLKQTLFSDRALPKIEKIIENIDVSTLDEGHILPNIGSTTFRGVWYPNLNSYLCSRGPPELIETPLLRAGFRIHFPYLIHR